MHDVATGLLTYRVVLPIELAVAFDALVIDDQDGLLFAITPTGIADVNLSSLAGGASRRGPHLRKKALPLATGSTIPGATRDQRQRGLQFDRPHLRHPDSQRP